MPMKALKPELVEMPAQKMAVVTTVGRPDESAENAMPALYGSVYTLKFDLKKRGFESFKVQCPRARYPDAHLKPKEEWTIHWGLPVPDDTTALEQKSQGVETKLETWEYGTVAQVLHLGAYSDECPTIELLQKFIKENGCVIDGEHEEEYLTRPTAKVVKTIVRYPVKKSG